MKNHFFTYSIQNSNAYTESDHTEIDKTKLKNVL